MEIEIPEALAGERVDRAVAFLTGLTRAEVAALVEAGAVRIAGAPVKTRSRRVAAGEHLGVDVPESSSPVITPDAEVPFEVVADNANVIVVDKPAGVVVHPGAGVRSSTLVHGLVARYPELLDVAWPDPERPGIVHRLDKETSGLLVVGRTPAAAEDLIEQLKARTVERTYLALALGDPAHDAGTIDAPVGRSSRDRTRMAVAAGGREARTRYRVIERIGGDNPVALLECKLETGRTHQIRVHLAAIGHAVAGDSRYRGRSAFGLKRPFLHAHELSFDDPGSGERRTFSSALPADLATALEAARSAT